MKLAELVLVMVPGSVEDERMLSALKYLKSPHQLDGWTSMCMLEGGWMPQRSVDDTWYKVMVVKCMLDMLVGDMMTWLLGLSELGHLE
eukprot:370975-Pelagomonas_calceolata.AAC.1